MDYLPGMLDKDAPGEHRRGDEYVVLAIISDIHSNKEALDAVLGADRFHGR